MSRRNSRTNERDVAVARHKKIAMVAAAVASILVALIRATIGDTSPLIHIENNTNVYAPGGTVPVTPDEVSADAGTLLAPQNR